MLTIYNREHRLHAPEFEIFRGKRVACFETPERADLIEQRLVERGNLLRAAHVDSASVLPQVHSARYLRFLQQAWSDWTALDAGNAQQQPSPSVWPVRTLRSDVEPVNFTAKLGLYSMDNGCSLVAGTWAAAKAGADAAASAAALLDVATAAGSKSQPALAKAVFCCIRPPGHHAGADFMGGYCFLNNAAIAAQALIEAAPAGTRKVAILDVDYHHGNGTQSIFYERPDVLFVSIHGDPATEYPFYLGYADECGAGEGEGFNLNLPLPAGSSAASWFAALETACERIARHGADALVVSLGLDTFAGDPISKFLLQADDFKQLGERLGAIALPTIFILEGGYAAAELAVNAVNVIEGFERALRV